MAHNSKNPTSDAEKIKKAIKLVKEGIISLQGASKYTGVPKHIICRYLENSTKKVKEKASVKVSERVLEVFNTEEEHQLLKDIKEYSSNQSFCLRTIQEIAYQFAKLKRKTYPSSWDEKSQADMDWLQMFIERYRHHSILRNLPLHTKINSKEYTPVTLMLHFKAAVAKCPSNLPPCNIWNIDEMILHNPPEILSSKQHVSSSHVTGCDESNNLTMIAAINAGGGNAPPMLIFPSSIEFQHFVLDGAPPGTIGGMNLCGELNDDLFLEYFRHFLRYAKPTRDLPCILLLNNHESHMCFPVQQLAKEHYVILITFHSNNVYRLQPIDKGVFEFFKTYYNQAAKHLMSTPDYKGKQMTTCDIVTLVGIAYPKIFTPSIIIQGFRVTGFYPFPEDTSQDCNRFDNTDHISSTSQVNDTCSCPTRKLSIMQSTSLASKPKKVEIKKAKKSEKVAKMVQFYQDDEDSSSDQNKMTKSEILARTLAKSKIRKFNTEPRKNEYKLILHENTTKAKISHLNSDYKVPSVSDSSSDDVFFSDDSDEFV